MEAKISKAQLEVWEWKAALYEELKKVPREKWAQYLIDKAVASRLAREKEKKNPEK